MTLTLTCCCVMLMLGQEEGSQHQLSCVLLEILGIEIGPRFVLLSHLSISTIEDEGFWWRGIGEWAE
uniref:Putative secreted protein n=1 Tax=Anopheles darlingi TaxID=43151 RepID=A0A2M4DBV0_ANODA